MGWYYLNIYNFTPRDMHLVKDKSSLIEVKYIVDAVIGIT